MATQTAVAPRQESPVAKLKAGLAHETTRQMFQDVLHDNAGAFIASILDLYQSDNYLQKCDPNAVIRECMKAASLKLPINKNLGFAYVVPYKDVPQFQMGWKGYVQLGLRTGQFKYLNAGCIYDGQRVESDVLSGAVRILGAAKSQTVIGYFAYMELINGFQKAVYITKDEATAHAKRYSRAYQYDLREKKATCPWSTDPDAMGMKTAVKMLAKFFPMTVEMARILDEQEESIVDGEIAENANRGPVIEAAQEAQKAEPAGIQPGF